ncbi:leucine-rich repeat-containing G-protein coupled receptor 5-like [Asterias rubens]|uniref:leucine-rich repeat-containing G-protein coupled receptor 5-like n=1 Tax=Asterias rubens TaxID=7604 RepID=UPI001455B09D|nr:leucine-rich repeat-containing G-protein coupled receptor 5-like [Asterias rubens]
MGLGEVYLVVGTFQNFSSHKITAGGQDYFDWPKNPNGGSVDIIAVDCTRRNLTEVPLDLPANTVEINLSFNNLTALPADAFSHVTRLRHLKLVGNRIRTLNEDVFRGLKELHSLDLQLNIFQKLPSKAFHPDLANLRTLNLNSNYIEDFPGHALLNLHSLRHLYVEGNRLNRIPTEAISLVPELTVLLLSSNAITMVQDHAFQNNTKLIELSLNNNSIQVISTHAFSGLYNLKGLDFRYNYHRIKNIKQGAFRNLTNLNALAISDVDNLSEFPDLSGTTSLERLTIDRCSLTAIPTTFCDGMHHLKELDLHNNKIESIPSFSNCSQLQYLNLGLNKLSSLESTPFQGLNQLSHLYLGENNIERIRADSFEGLSAAYELDLGNNDIIEIDEKAFLPLKQLETLRLNGNRFPDFPTAGLERLLNIYTFDNIHLESFPKPSELPKIIIIISSYAYHCCSYISLNEVNSVKNTPEIKEIYTWTLSSSTYDYNGGNGSSSDWAEEWYDSTWEPQYNLSGVPIQIHSNISCSPVPGPFLPCVDLFGSWFLRIGVYFVFLLAVIGNAIVIFVILVSHTKMDVPRFLICNLAFADFFLGVYLGFLAGVDTSTLGVFHKYGAQWQLSPGCSLAGFLAVFSSEFSIYTLSVITLERFYAIKHALHLEKRMKLPHAVAVMAFGWIFAVVVAIMPLVHISSYYKFPVCLPLDITTTIGKVYGSSILLLNVTAFVIIMLCYANIYMAIQGSHAWNCNDSRVARRMSLLVFTDFACWAPIAFFSLTSAFGLQLISMEGAKVLTIFVLPLNSCANPFLYTILTKQFKKDCQMILRSLRNQVLRPRKSTNPSLGRHPSMRSTQAHQISQLPWRTNGSISQDITGDGCMVSSFKTENGEPSSNVYTMSTMAETHTPQQNGSCSNDHSHSDSSAMLDPMLLTNSDLDDLRRGSTSPLLDLMTQVTSKDPEAKPKSKVRRKFSIPFPFFSTRSPTKEPTHSSSANTSIRRSPTPQRQKRSHSITEGLLHKMNRKRPLTSMKSAPGISSPISRSSEKLDQGINGISIGICITVPDKQNQNKTVKQTEADEKVYSIDVPKEPPKPPLSNFPIDQAGMETQTLLEIGASNNYFSENRSPHDTDSPGMLAAHENPVRDQLSSATPSPQLHRPEKLVLVDSVVPADKDVPDNDSGLGTASSPLPDSTESMRFLPVSLETPEVVCNSELDDHSSRVTSQPSVLGGLFGHLTRSEPSRCYNEVPDSPTKASREICRPKESVV